MRIGHAVRTGNVDNRFPLREEFRDYQLATKFGWTKSEINEQPAVWLDWMLAIDAEVQEARADANGSDF
jgi:hypothetical protein